MAKDKRTRVHREDVKPAGMAPPAVRNWLAKVGGFNPFSEPNYRLVLAQHVYEMTGGEFHDFPDDASISERGGLDLQPVGYEVEDARGGVKQGTELVVMGPAASKLERVVTEMRWDQKYPHLDGWILQRWYPCTHPAYGSREEWNRLTLKGRPDILLLGPFPVYGEYELCSIWQEEADTQNVLITNAKTGPEGITGAALREVPSLRVLHKAICASEDAALDSRSLGATRNARIAARLNEWVKREELRRERTRERRAQMIKDHMKPYWGTSLEAARLREKLAEKAGIRSHVGA